MKRLLRNALRQLGYDLVRYSPNSHSEFGSLTDLSEQQKRIILTVKPFTMTSTERLAALINAVTYVTLNAIPGDITECGVWKGGSMMAIALTLLANGDQSRSLYLYDTFEGMSPPTANDKTLDNLSAAEQLRSYPRETGIWAYASSEEVRANLLSTGYPKEKIHLIEGKVEDTIPKTLPPSLSLLRLDTDWYESTKHELKYLYPLLETKGILIIDDYGHWQGARKAVDEYFRERDEKVFLHRIDYTGRILVKSGV